MPVDCQEPDTLEAVAPCLNCNSMHELLVILVMMFSIQNNTDGEIALLEAASAKFRNMGDLQLTRELIAAMPDAWRAGLDFADLGGDYACLKCKGDAELKAMLLNQWCVYWAT